MNTKQLTKLQGVLTLAHSDYETALKKHAFFKVHNRVTSEDLVQETFMKTWKYLVRGGRIDTMRAFLFHVLNNLVVEEYRKRQTTSLDALLQKGFEPSTPHPQRLFEIMDGKAAVILIQSLPEKYKKVMHLRYLQDRSPKEISMITGQSKNAIAVQVHRGLAKLKHLYNKGTSKRLAHA
ncbi:MAG: RNA polymerase sigma factor [bacterium]|nr:RNA polymerase sigma factor [bacterium]